MHWGPWLAVAVSLAVALPLRRWARPHLAHWRLLRAWPTWLRTGVLLAAVLGLGEPMVHGSLTGGLAYGAVLGLVPIPPRTRRVAPARRKG
ncbi:membrane protein of unknown function [Candidatus Hydrogenisulfobacillus filiaventi]|uniref:Uncharacterized protein n=1 Tax=Candidatus Hydrogenisulfobacillus filiaventi TaxID=2707344 RepID=A0A6F8ZIW6_9FIRM|nr:hypothetical protein [Bacillota bacterium]CAB1129882.1 membrane protein of unknown function [Candidatus Hydrogenisulfobacillus filiaventi]